MKTYGHLRDEHSQKMAGIVTFGKAPQNGNAGPPPPPESATKPPADSPENPPPEQAASVSVY